MSEEYLVFLAVVGFALFFVVLWVAIVTLVATLGGWKRLQEEFPDRPSAHIYKRLSMRSAQLGHPIFGASYGNCLNIEVCEPGLRISVWKIFGPFSKPILFPWGKLKVEPYQWFLWRSYRLRWGEGNRNALIVYRNTAREIAEASRGNFVLPEG